MKIWLTPDRGFCVTSGVIKNSEGRCVFCGSKQNHIEGDVINEENQASENITEK